MINYYLFLYFTTITSRHQLYMACLDPHAVLAWPDRHHVGVKGAFGSQALGYLPEHDVGVWVRLIDMGKLSLLGKPSCKIKHIHICPTCSPYAYLFFNWFFTSISVHNCCYREFDFGGKGVLAGMLYVCAYFISDDVVCLMKIRLDSIEPCPSHFQPDICDS